MSFDLKRFTFYPSSVAISGTSITNQYSPHPVTGVIEKIYCATNLTGSIYVNVSGTNENLLTDVAPSGTNAKITYPVAIMKYPNQTTAGSPYTFDQLLLDNDYLYLCGSGTTSGTSASLSYLTIVYR